MCGVVVIPPSARKDRIRYGAAHRLAQERARHAAAVLDFTRHGDEIGNEIAVEERRGALDTEAGRELLIRLELEAVRLGAECLVDVAPLRAPAARARQGWPR